MQTAIFHRSGTEINVVACPDANVLFLIPQRDGSSSTSAEAGISEGRSVKIQDAAAAPFCPLFPADLTGTHFDFHRY